MNLTTRLSAHIESFYGGLLTLTRTFSATNEALTKYQHDPIGMTIESLQRLDIGLNQIVTASYLYIQTSSPVDVTIMTKVGPTDPPLDNEATFRLNDAILIGADITALSVYNPQSAAVLVQVSAVGV